MHSNLDAGLNLGVSVILQLSYIFLYTRKSIMKALSSCRETAQNDGLPYEDSLMSEV